MLCRFGTEIVPARPTGEVAGWDALLCDSPPVALPSDQSYLTVGVQVTVNNDTLAFGPTQASYTYFDTEVAAAIGSIYPSSGPARGGTEVKVRATLHEGNTRRRGAPHRKVPRQVERCPTGSLEPGGDRLSLRAQRGGALAIGSVGLPPR